MIFDIITVFPEMFTGVLEKSPKLYIINLYIANCYYQLKNWDKAIEHFHQVSRQQPDNYNKFTINKLIKNKNRSFILLINIFLFKVHSKYNNIFYI